MTHPVEHAACVTSKGVSIQSLPDIKFELNNSGAALAVARA